MPKEPDKKKAKGKPAAETDDEQEPKVTLKDDSADLSRSFSMRPSPPRGTKKASKSDTGALTRPTPLGLGAARAPMPTLTDPEELEAARRRSVGSGAEHRKVTPVGVGALSLANARAPTLPPQDIHDDKPKKTESISSLSAVDAEWDDMATTPPPPDQAALIEATVTAGRARPAPPATEAEMKDRVSVGDFSGALAVAERILEEQPNNRAALECAETCRETLRKMYTARIGPLGRVPVVSVPRDQLRWLSIDHRAGFVLSLIDGVSSVESILDVTGMPELDALRILAELVQQRIISFR